MTKSNGTLVSKRDKNDQPARVLIADDDNDFRKMLIRRVERLGHSVVGAEDGTKAIQALKKEFFNLLIVDLNMPGENGMEVIKIGQNIHPSMQVIVVTGEGNVDNAIEALRYRVFDFLTKPLNFLRFFEITVQQALDHAFRERKKNQMMVEFQRMALIDPLTGLYNRLKLNEELEREIQRGKHLNQPFSLIMMDLDGLKSINDTYGHSFGDELLCQIADVIQDKTQKLNIPVRYGGDEFLILLPGIGVNDAKAMAEEILEIISSMDIYGIPFTISFGVAEWDDSCHSNEDFIGVLDQAVNQSKENDQACITVR